MSYLKPCVFASAVVVFGTLSGVAGAQTIERMQLTDNELTCAQVYAEVQQMETMVQLAGTMAPAAAPQPVALPVPAARPAQQLSAIQQAVLNHPNNANLSPEQKATLIAQTGLAETRGNAAVAGLYAGAPTANALRGSVIADPGVQAAMARARAAGMSEAQIAATVGVGMQQGGLGALGGANGLAGLAGLLPGLGQQVAPAVPVSAGQAYAQAGGLAGMLGAGMSAQGGGAGGLAGMFGALAGMAQPSAQATPAPATAAVAVATPAPGASGGLGAQAQARKEHLTQLFLSRGCKMADVRK